MQRIHSFKAGRQTASNGTVIDFSEADLAATAAAYDPAVSEAPIVVGHPTTDAPAYGWIKSMSVQGPDLYAEPHQVNPAFAEMVKAGAFKKVSISLYPKDHPHNPVPGVYYPRHLGYLGAQPPAVKGLKPTEFAEDAACLELELDFTEHAPDTSPSNTPEPSSLPSDNAHTPGADGSPEGSCTADTGTPTENTVTPEEAAALKARAEQAEANLAAAQTTLRSQAATANTAAHAAFAEALVAEARVTEADKDFIVATLDHLEPPVLAGEQHQVVEFGEGDAKKPMAEVFKGWLKGLPKRVDFSEQATRERAAQGSDAQGAVQYAEGTPQEQIDLDKRIRKYASDHKLSYADAATHVASRPAKT